MTADARQAALDLTTLGYHVTPLAYKSKAATVRDWQNMILSLDQIDTYFPSTGTFGIGLLLGTEVEDGIFTAAIDIDLDDHLLITRAITALGGISVRKYGIKGATIFVTTRSKLRTRRLFRIDESGKRFGALEFLASGTHTAIPPSIHPETKKPYKWLTDPLTKVPPNKLPVLTTSVMDEITLAVKDPESPFFDLNEMQWYGPSGGGTVDDSILRASAIMVTRGWTDDDILDRVRRAIRECLDRNPEHSDKWNDKIFTKRLEGMIRDAREKGFEKTQRRGKGERRIEMASQLIEKLGGLDNLWNEPAGLRRYADGHWPLIDRRALEHQTIHLDRSWIEANDARAIVDTAMTLAPILTGIPAPAICLRNGTYDLNRDLFREWDKDDLTFAQLPYEYDEDATCPTYDAFLRMTFAQRGCENRDDVSVLKCCNLFNEFLGLTLINDLSFDKMLVVKGATSSGKSTLARVFSVVHDPTTISTVQPHKLHKERYLSALVGKLVSVATEIPSDVYVQEETLKSIITGDGVTIRRLYQEPIDNVILPTRMFLACNEVFRVRDSSGAVERRLIILETRDTIPQDERDRDIFNRIRAEAPGIFLRALSGLQSLRKRGRFDEPDDVEAALKEFSEDSNPILGWINERTHQGQRRINPEYEYYPDGPTMSTDLYDDYRLWADRNGFKAMSSITWGGRLKLMGYNSRVQRIGNATVRVRDLNLIETGAGRGDF